MDISMEIRKLPYNYIQELALILGSSWKELMSIIPKSLDKNNYKCNISKNNPQKYNSEHIRLLEDASFKTQRTCLEILFDEWGTSGRIRPAIGHLLHLLIQSELYRAADYVADVLLDQLPPVRPLTGPAALVTTDLRVQEIKKILISMNYPEFLVSYLMDDSYDVNINRSDIIRVTSDPLISRPNTKRNLSRGSISSSEIDRKRQMHEQSSDSSHIIPDISAIMNSKNRQIEYQSSRCLPKISALNMISTQTEQSVPTITNSEESSRSYEVPDLSILNRTHSQKEESSTDLQIPQLDILLSKDTNLKKSSTLPVLKLSTSLPHFTFSKITAATNYFDETPYKDNAGKGRFLGSGAFGSVYLGLDITDQPVAVKKLFVDKLDVRVDDLVIKQFRNEVEILSKYKHENLVSIVGYSCDGPAYCLLYEFISGGALKDRLQSIEEKLVWTDRLQIALGTSKAISYLHTAYTVPLIHRDIKSANILIDQNNKPKLCDFGLIRTISNQKTSTRTGALGTSAYMSREAFRGDVSVKLDTFSFGVVLLELITSLEPIDESREGCDIVTHVEEICENNSIAPLIDLKAGSWFDKGINFAEELYKIAIKCLEENKRKRPTMVTIMEELIKIVKKSE